LGDSGDGVLAMMKGDKTFVIGDIHGRLGMLENLMAKIPWRPEKDALIFLGDYVDRGPDPRGVVDYILSLIRNYSRISCVLGNHEGMLLDYMAGVNQKLYLTNGGGGTLKAYGGGKGPLSTRSLPEMPSDHMMFYLSLKSFVDIEGYYLVHAGFRPGVPMALQEKFDMMWIREPFISSTYDFGKKVIFGHTPSLEPLVMKNKIGLDTGAAYGKRLCCIELPAEKFYFAAG